MADWPWSTDVRTLSPAEDGDTIGPEPTTGQDWFVVYTATTIGRRPPTSAEAIPRTYVDNVAELSNLKRSQFAADNIVLRGYNAAWDGGGSTLTYTGSNTPAADGVIRFADDDGFIWKRTLGTSVTPQMAGVEISATVTAAQVGSDQSVRMQAYFDAFNEGEYDFTSSTDGFIVIENTLNLLNQGRSLKLNDSLFVKRSATEGAAFPAVIVTTPTFDGRVERQGNIFFEIYKDLEVGGFPCWYTNYPYAANEKSPYTEPPGDDVHNKAFADKLWGSNDIGVIYRDCTTMERCVINAYNFEIGNVAESTRLTSTSYSTKNHYRAHQINGCRVAFLVKAGADLSDGNDNGWFNENRITVINAITAVNDPTPDPPNQDNMGFYGVAFMCDPNVVAANWSRPNQNVVTDVDFENSTTSGPSASLLFLSAANTMCQNIRAEADRISPFMCAAWEVAGPAETDNRNSNNNTVTTKFSIGTPMNNGYNNIWRANDLDPAQVLLSDSENLIDKFVYSGCAGAGLSNLGFGDQAGGVLRFGSTNHNNRDDVKNTITATSVRPVAFRVKPEHASSQDGFLNVQYKFGTGDHRIAVWCFDSNGDLITAGARQPFVLTTPDSFNYFNGSWSAGRWAMLAGMQTQQVNFRFEPRVAEAQLDFTGDEIIGINISSYANNKSSLVYRYPNLKAVASAPEKGHFTSPYTVYRESDSAILKLTTQGDSYSVSAAWAAVLPITAGCHYSVVDSGFHIWSPRTSGNAGTDQPSGGSQPGDTYTDNSGVVWDWIAGPVNAISVWST